MKLFKRKNRKLCKRCQVRVAVTRVAGGNTAPGSKRARSAHYAYLRGHDLCGQCHRSVKDWKKSLDLKIHEESHMLKRMDVFMWAGIAL